MTQSENPRGFALNLSVISLPEFLMKWTSKQTVETIGVLAVVFSLLLVAYEVRQANRIAVVNTEFDLRNRYQATNIALLNNPDMVDFMIRMNTSGEPLEGPDEVRAMAWTFLRLNTWVATAIAYESGVTTEQTYQNILDNIDNVIGMSSPEMRQIWRTSINKFPSLKGTQIFEYANSALARYETAGSE
jgi:hypothetical protein